MRNNELPYWLALAHMPKITTRKKNDIIVQLFKEGKTIVDFFHYTQDVWISSYNITNKEVDIFLYALSEVSNYAFLVEDVLEQGYSIIPITSKDYSPLLKKNLGRQAPTIIYAKGNLKIMQEDSIAIVGSRKANDFSLQFTDNIAKKATKEYKVVVSGFAKGVDKQALDSALKYKGQSIIVLPQGIMTFSSGFKSYYKQIISGDVLVLSSFYPKSSWKKELAMARNPIIYGLAKDIYVAESSEKGGTWSGVIDGLRKKRTIYVRKSELNEQNANGLLIEKGAIPVNFDGETVEINNKTLQYKIEEPSVINLNEANCNGSTSFDAMVKNVIGDKSFQLKELSKLLKLEWSLDKLRNKLNKLDFIEVSKEKGKNIYRIKTGKKDLQRSLF